MCQPIYVYLGVDLLKSLHVSLHLPIKLKLCSAICSSLKLKILRLSRGAEAQSNKLNANYKFVPKIKLNYAAVDEKDEKDDNNDGNNKAQAQ